jgi:hypothetical protein
MATDATGAPTSLGIPKFDVNADAPSGLGGNAQMDYIDALINAHTSVNTGSSLVLANKLVSTDANPAFKLTGDGKLQWGAGGAFALDTNLYRSNTGALQTDGRLAVAGSDALGANLYVKSALTTTLAFGTSVTTDAQFRFNVRGDGKLEWSPGNSAQDTNLYRVAAATLKTDGGLQAGGHFQVAAHFRSGDVAASNTNLVQAGRKLAIYDTNDTLMGYVQLYTG